MLARSRGGFNVFPEKSARLRDAGTVHVHFPREGFQLKAQG